MQHFLFAALLAAPLLSPLPLEQAQDGGAEEAGETAQDAPQEPARPVLDPLHFSILSAPLYLGEAPPEVRSLRHVHLPYAGIPGARRDAPTREAAEVTLREALAELAGGADFADVARRYSRARDAGRGGVLGSFAPGVLARPYEEFLRAAEIGDISELIEDDQGFHILQRVETYAAARHILLRGDDADTRRRARALRSELRAGADFAELAREHSEDPLTKERGGVIAIFERGPSDVLLKAAAFDSPMGEVVGPLTTPMGLHLFERLPVRDVDPALADPTWVRGGAIVLAYDGARGINQAAPRTQEEARELGLDLVEQVRAGADFAVLARAINDDVGGRERAGDLGWIHRRSPKTSPVLDRLFTAAPGEVFDPVLSEVGVMIVQRAPADE